MKRLTFLLGSSLLLLAAKEPPPFERPVADADLATMRGGFSLPNGIDVSLSVISDTRLNGSLVLRSVLRLDTQSTLSVFVPKSGESPHVQNAAPGESPPPAMPTIDYDPNMGISVVPGTRGFNVAVGGDPLPEDADAAGLAAVEIAPGDSVDTPAGTVSLVEGDGSTRVRLAGDMFDTTHLFGNALGALSVNTGNDRAIETTTSINLSLANVSPDVIGSALLDAETLALDSTAMLAR